jgi:pimeloyl-ACP methyl ester carboxylesterase
MQSHYISGDVRTAKGMRAYWAVEPQGTAILFVHGWKGQAVGTWSDFERLLSASPKCSSCDLIFYAYDSLRQQTLISATDLYRYLNLMFNWPLQLINKDLEPEAERGTDFYYKRIILVAHSLGAIICRQALLRAYTAHDRWPDKTELVLFAPAHLGAPNIISFITEVAGFFKVPLAIGAAKFWWPTINELREDSNTITDLAKKTAAALATGGANYLRARKVFFGKRERIVTVGNFCEDAPADSDSFPNKGHVGVCKPKDGFRAPLDEVLRIL